MKIYKYIFIFLLAFSTSSLPANPLVKEMIKDLSLKQKIGQMLMIGLPGKRLNKTSQNIIKKNSPGGIVLFGYNLSNNPTKLKKYLGQLQKQALGNRGIPLFISIDQEGGRVKRITTGVTQFPGNMALGIVNDQQLTFEAAKILGLELRSLGINMNLAPVLDVNNNPRNPVINTRSFGSNPQIVAALGQAYLTGLQNGGCLAIGKHFPGHGNTDQDSHLTLPKVSISLEQLKEIELLPFKTAIQAKIEGLMTAHLAFPLIQKNNPLLPATCSKYFLTKLLKKEMNFSGLIMTDDMEMKGVSKNNHIGLAAVKAILAGADIILLSSHGKNVNRIISSIKKAIKNKEISLKRINQSLEKIISLKLKYKIASYDKKKKNFIKASYNFSPEDLKFLQKAIPLNQKLSAKAIFYHGDKKILASPNLSKIIITKDKSLTKKISQKPALKVFKNLKQIKSKLIKNKKTTIFYHLTQNKDKILNNIYKYCSSHNLKLIIICSGDPYPLVNLIKKNSLKANMLFSFSNTSESLNQLAKVIKGETKPREKINIDLGI